MALKLVFVVLLSAGCSSSNKTQSPDPLAACRQVAEQKLGASAAVYPNDDKTFALCMTVEKLPNRPETPVRFFVYDLKKSKVVHEDELANGLVEWKDTDHVRIEMLLGMASAETETNVRRFLLNVRTMNKEEIK